jgi:hypothetical protein
MCKDSRLDHLHEKVPSSVVGELGRPVCADEIKCGDSALPESLLGPLQVCVGKSRLGARDKPLSASEFERRAVD